MLERAKEYFQAAFALGDGRGRPTSRGARIVPQLVKTFFGRDDGGRHVPGLQTNISVSHCRVTGIPTSRQMLGTCRRHSRISARSSFSLRSCRASTGSCSRPHTSDLRTQRLHARARAKAVKITSSARPACMPEVACINRAL